MPIEDFQKDDSSFSIYSDFNLSFAEYINNCSDICEQFTLNYNTEGWYEDWVPQDEDLSDINNYVSILKKYNLPIQAIENFVIDNKAIYCDENNEIKVLNEEDNYPLEDDVTYCFLSQIMFLKMLRIYA